MTNETEATSQVRAAYEQLVDALHKNHRSSFETARSDYEKHCRAVQKEVNAGSKQFADLGRLYTRSCLEVQEKYERGIRDANEVFTKAIGKSWGALTASNVCEFVGISYILFAAAGALRSACFPLYAVPPCATTPDASEGIKKG